MFLIFKLLVWCVNKGQAKTKDYDLFFWTLVSSLLLKNKFQTSQNDLKKVWFQFLGINK